MTLTEFLAARLGEDEAAAKAAARGAPAWTQVDPLRSPGLIESNHSVVTYDEGYPDEHQAAHIVRHDPARVLREVEAGRKILVKYDTNPGAEGYAYTAALEWAVAVLAAVYDSHPDYDEAWRP